jgi:D-alanyl-D-alanine carboxypeptidase
MKYLINLATLILLSVAICAAQPHQKTTDLIRDLQTILDNEVAATPSIPGELLHITSPRHKLKVSLASGLFDRKTKTPLDPHHGFRIASVTKTFLAATVFRLSEDGKLKLDDPITRYLPAEYLEILERDGYKTNAITIRHILRHTSGLHDYATDQKYYAAVLGNPGKRWTRKEQVMAAMEWGSPLFEPGKGFKYSDTGYVLLGEIVEKLTGKSLAEGYRTVLNFKKLGLDETYLETLEPAPARAQPLSHPYFQTQDALQIDASHDLYGGGGLVSTTEDLAIFFRALLTGKVFKKKTTLEAMLSVDGSSSKVGDDTFAAGIARRTIQGVECWGHRGFWGTSAYHCPSIDLTIVRQLNQAQRDRLFVFDDLYTRVFNKLGIVSNGSVK